MTRTKKPRLTVPLDGTTDEKRTALQKLRRRQRAITTERERSGKPARPDPVALARDARQQQVAVALGTRIVPISETDVECVDDELMDLLANEITDETS